MREKSTPVAPAKPPRSAKRDARLAAALRDNLMKRKVQQRVRQTSPMETTPKGGGSSDGDEGAR